MAFRNSLVFFALFLIAALSTAVQARLTFSYADCGDTTDPMRPVQLAVNPNNVDPGAVITISEQGNVTEVINNGTVVVVKASDGIMLSKTTTPLCDFFQENLGISCPIQPGIYNHAANRTVQPDPIGDVFVVTTTAFQGLKTVFCVQLITAIRPGF